MGRATIWIATHQQQDWQGEFVPSWLDAGLALLCTIFLVATARVEERENIEYFGVEYSEYMQRTKMFIPYLL